MVNYSKKFLLELLGELAKADGIDKLETYDIAYYSRLYVEKTCDFDKEQLKKYFPVEIKK